MIIYVYLICFGIMALGWSISTACELVIMYVNWRDHQLLKAAKQRTQAALDRQNFYEQYRADPLCYTHVCLVILPQPEREE
jgi:hypothetical protein